MQIKTDEQIAQAFKEGKIIKIELPIGSSWNRAKVIYATNLAQLNRILDIDIKAELVSADAFAEQQKRSPMYDGSSIMMKHYAGKETLESDSVLKKLKFFGIIGFGPEKESQIWVLNRIETEATVGKLSDYVCDFNI